MKKHETPAAGESAAPKGHGAPSRIARLLAALLPMGALGASVALAAPAVRPADPAASPAADQDVAARLQSIRRAVSQVTAEQSGLQAGDPNIVKAWWANWLPGWGNGGWGNGGWRNWHNGWGNGGWHNWHNGWNNWHNFWHNW